jgi:hypothetical protein
MRTTLQESSGVGKKVALAIGILAICFAVGLVHYSGKITTNQQLVEKVFPDDRFPH